MCESFQVKQWLNGFVIYAWLGYIDIDEMVDTFRKLGVHMDHKEATELLKR